jgi:tRNA-2-methylthio-N6-dimethylallyladenosine synthase
MFIFSPRPGTAAAEMVDDFVDPDVIQDRFQRLVAVQTDLTVRRSRHWVGHTLEVLSEGPSKKDPTVATTRTRGGKVVHVAGDHPAGTFFDVAVTGAALHHLTGVAV